MIKPFTKFRDQVCRLDGIEIGRDQKPKEERNATWRGSELVTNSSEVSRTVLLVPSFVDFVSIEFMDDTEVWLAIRVRLTQGVVSCTGYRVINDGHGGGYKVRELFRICPISRNYLDAVALSRASFSVATDGHPTGRTFISVSIFSSICVTMITRIDRG